MEIILDLLQDIRKRPGLFLGKVSLELLNAFIGGCCCYCSKLNGCFPDFFYKFQRFIENRYQDQSEQGWWSIIRFSCNNDEEAFYKFFDLLDEFLTIYQGDE